MLINKLQRAKNRLILKILNAGKRYFLTGMIIVMPFVATYAILKFLFTFIYDNLPKNILFKVVPFYFHDYPVVQYSDVIVSFIVTFVFIILTGYFFSNYFGKKMIQLGEYLLNQLPIVNKIYSILKQIIEQIVSNMQGSKKSMFHKVALIEFPRKGVNSLGFVTSESDVITDKETGLKYFNVFVPTTPNPTSGFLIIVPETEIKFVDMNMEDAMKYIISAGMVADKKKADDK